MRRLLLQPLWPQGGVPISVPPEGLVLGRHMQPQYSQDLLLSPEHVFVRAVPGDQVLVCDRNSWNGTFYRFATRRRLQTGDEFRIGQQWIRWEAVDSSLCTYDPRGALPDRHKLGENYNVLTNVWGRLVWLLGPQQEGSALLLTQPQVLCGRTQGSIRLPQDPYLSSQHLYWIYQEGQAWVEDANSRNGSFVRLRGEQILPIDTCLWVGQQVFQIQAA